MHKHIYLSTEYIIIKQKFKEPSVKTNQNAKQEYVFEWSILSEQVNN